MTIDPLIDPDPQLVAQAAEDLRVRRSFDAAHEALTRLRFHEGLRRGWAGARAEAGVREGAAIAQMLGAKIRVEDLRHASMGDGSQVEEAALTSRDPALDLALGAWRCQVGLIERFAPLNSRVPQGVRPLAFPALLATIHRDLCSGLVESHRLPYESVAVPTSPAALALARAYLGVAAPAMARAAALVAHFRFREVFSPNSGAVGAACARWLLVTEGVDPTGVCPITAMDANNPQAAARALAGWASANREGLVRWMIHFAAAVEYGASLGVDIALHVQAGRLN